jgi:hypothetical protein
MSVYLQAVPTPLRPGRIEKRADVPAHYGVEYRPGKWHCGHVSLESDVVLFVTLDGSYARQGRDGEIYRWISQNKCKSSGKKGQEILSAGEPGAKAVHLWERSSKGPFRYLGTVSYIQHEGEQPMAVTFRLRPVY